MTRLLTPARIDTTHTISTLKGAHTGSLLSCLEWQAEHQGAMANIDSVSIDDLTIANADDPHRRESDLTAEEAEPIVRARIDSE